MNMHSVEFVHGKCVDGPLDIIHWVPISRNVQVQAPVGKFWCVCNGNGREIRVNPLARRMEIKQLSEGFKCMKNSYSRYSGDSSGSVSSDGQIVRLVELTIQGLEAC